jgi:hypothetical protein
MKLFVTMAWSIVYVKLEMKKQSAQLETPAGNVAKKQE